MYFVTFWKFPGMSCILLTAIDIRDFRKLRIPHCSDIKINWRLLVVISNIFCCGIFQWNVFCPINMLLLLFFFSASFHHSSQLLHLALHSYLIPSPLGFQHLLQICISGSETLCIWHDHWRFSPYKILSSSHWSITIRIFRFRIQSHYAIINYSSQGFHNTVHEPRSKFRKYFFSTMAECWTL